MVRVNGSVSKGSIYTIFESRGPLKTSLFDILNVSGYEIAVKGSLQILGFLNGTDNLYRARVIESMDSVEAGKPYLFKFYVAI